MTDLLNVALRDELLDMVEEDQAMRREALKDPSAYRPDVDHRHTKRMKQIIDEHGFPGKSQVEPGGAKAAWLLIQHADHEPGFQQRCLPLIYEAGLLGEIELERYAYLEDRVRLNSNRNQLYGTQWRVMEPTRISVRPLEDAARVDELRANSGIPPLRKLLTEGLAEIYSIQVLKCGPSNLKIELEDLEGRLTRAHVVEGETIYDIQMEWGDNNLEVCVIGVGTY